MTHFVGKKANVMLRGPNCTTPSGLDLEGKIVGYVRKVTGFVQKPIDSVKQKKSVCQSLRFSNISTSIIQVTYETKLIY